MEQNRVNIRIANVEDAENILKIYAPYIEKTAITFEYEVPCIEEFKERIRSTRQKYPYLVAEADGEITGYAYASAFKERSAYDWCVETSIYVDRDKKGMGIGKSLYRALEHILKEQGILNLNACIASPVTEDEYLTKDSIRFHERLGYQMVAEFHQCGYKFHRWYDMVWMEKHIGVHTGEAKPVKPFSEIENSYETDRIF